MKDLIVRIQAGEATPSDEFFTFLCICVFPLLILYAIGLVLPEIKKLLGQNKSNTP